MIINKFKFPIYGTIIVLSLIIGCIYIYKSVKKEEKNSFLPLYFVMLFPFVIGLSILSTVIIGLFEGKFIIGFSSFGAGVGLLLSAFIFEKIVQLNGKLIKYSTLALPLIYGISKLACFFAGCCYGIPYNGLFKVKYPFVMDKFLFPVQLLESIIFIILFILLNKFKKNSNIIYYVILSSAILKYSLDFLRYEHVNSSITSNQIVCIISVIVLIIYLIIIKISKNKSFRTIK